MTTEVSPRVDMSDGELHLIAEITDVPIEKVRGIVWLAEWRMRDKHRSQYGPMWPLGPTGPGPMTPVADDPCAGCVGTICGNAACPKRTIVTYSDGLA